MATDEKVAPKNRSRSNSRNGTLFSKAQDRGFDVVLKIDDAIELLRKQRAELVAINEIISGSESPFRRAA